MCLSLLLYPWSPEKFLPFVPQAWLEVERVGGKVVGGTGEHPRGDSKDPQSGGSGLTGMAVLAFSAAIT